jgi:glucokinase
VLDIGGSHVSAAVVDLESRAILEGSEARDSVDPDASADALLEVWGATALSAHDRAGRPVIVRVGIAMPGPFEYATGISRLEHKFVALYGCNVGDALQRRSFEAKLGSVPIAFGNDATLFALGEWWAGAARGHKRVLGVTLGTGLGGGFVVDGQPRYAGDSLPPNGAIWNLPYLEGIAEDAVSGRALEHAYTARTGRWATPVQIAQAARGGDAEAEAVFLELGEHLGRVLKPWVQRFRPGCLVVGGNLARAWTLFRTTLEAELRDEPLEVHASALFDRANLLGAAALGIEGRGR